MPKVTFIIDGETRTVEFETGALPYTHHGKPESFLDVAKNLDIPLELHAELWPDEVGGMRLVVSWRRDAVLDATARDCATRFAEALEPVLVGRRE